MSTLEARLRAGLVVSGSGCWEWQGYKQRGYGRIAIHHAESRLTHRVAYELWVGPITPGLFVCHSCDNPPCCNPEHLWLGTSRENTRDAAAKGRLGKPKLLACKRGHAMSEENSYYRPDNGKRSCLTCHLERSRRWKAEHMIGRRRVA